MTDGGTALAYIDHRDDPERWAEVLRISTQAVDLYLASDVVDLHNDSFLWSRVLPGYDVRRRGRPRVPLSPVLNQADLPRVREAAIDAVVWDIVSNPWRRQESRDDTTIANIHRVRATLDEFPDEFARWRSLSD